MKSAIFSAACLAAEGAALAQKRLFPQPVKPLMKTRQLCSAEALLHPKSIATSSFSAAC
jgi:hypothetical protein